jgi:hypothetical protein
VSANTRSDVGAPKNLGEEYRWNLPVLYWSCDSQFLDYFGLSALEVVAQAFDILNTNVFRGDLSSYSPELTEFPLAARLVNNTARALSLVDLKSAVLQDMTEQLGLADPIRFAWCLHDRYHDGGPLPCPQGMQYLTIGRNFSITPSSPTNLQNSAYVNTVFYTYTIQDYCGSPPPYTAPCFTIPTNPDPFYAARYAPVSAGDQFPLGYGDFLNSLSRDDIAGLRYLMRGGNVNYEATPADVILYLTNTSPAALQLLVTTNLTQFMADTLTNDPAGLQALYPDLQIDAATPYFTNVVLTNVSYYYTNSPWDLAGALPRLVAATNYDTTVATLYHYNFSNVVTNNLVLPNGYVFTNNLQVFTNGQPLTTTTVTVIETNIGTPGEPWMIYGTGGTGTNVTTFEMQTNLVVGDYFIVPTNACGILLLSNVLSHTTYVTNTLITATNDPAAGGTGTNFQFFSRTIVYHYTNHFFAYFPVECVPASVGLRRGIERMQFVQRAYDSLLGIFFEPVTNFYTMVTVSNSADLVQTFRRVVATPDILITAQDLAAGPNGLPVNYASLRSTPNYNETYKPANLAGPGTLEPAIVLTMNKVGLVYHNTYPFLGQKVGRDFVWGSFDGTTNAPVVYPNGTSIVDLENSLILQVTTASLPPARVGAAYLVDLAGTGGSAPYTWSLAPASGGLPSGLSVRFDGTLGGQPEAGTDGVYDIIVRLTDGSGRYAERALTLTVAGP